MVSVQKSRGKTSSFPRGLACGTMISIGITLLGVIVLGNLIHTQTLRWENVGYGVLVIILLAAFMGATAAYRKIKRQRMLVCVISGMVYFCVLLSVTALFFGGQYEAVGVTGGLVFAGSGTAGLLGIAGKRGGDGGKTRRHRG